MAERILLVEDDRRVRRATALTLADEGYEVLEAEDGSSGLRLLAERRPELAILDVMLPDIDGFEVCREIRKRNDLPIIFLTAKTDTVDVVVGLESGADDYLTKPFAPKELVARVRPAPSAQTDRKSTRLNSSHTVISYAVFCLKKK